MLLSTVLPPSIPLLFVPGLPGAGLGLLLFTVQESGGSTEGLLMLLLLMLSPAPAEVLVPGRGPLGTVLLSPAGPPPPRVPLLLTVTLPVVPLPASRAGRVDSTVMFPVEPRGRVEFTVTFPGRVVFSKGAVALLAVLLLRALHGVVPLQGAGMQAPVVLLKVVPCAHTHLLP